MKARSLLFLLLAAAAITYVWTHPAKRPDDTGAVLSQETSPGDPEPQENETAENGDQASPLRLTPSATVAGNYLAARFAVARDDLDSADKYYARAIDAVGSPEERQYLYERSLPAAIGAGDMERALKISADMDLKQPTATAQLAVLLQLVEGFKNNDAKKIEANLPLLRSDGFGRLLKPLLEAWNKVGRKDYAPAITRLEDLQKEFPSLKPLVQMHLAFIYDDKDDAQAAELYYSRALQDNLSIRMAYIAGQFYERKGKASDASKLYETVAKQMPSVPWPKAALARVNQGEIKKQPFIIAPANGASAALYDVATVLHQENSSRLAVLYAQMAHYLMPQDEFTSLLLGDILALNGNSDAGRDFFKAIPETSDLYTLAQLRLAQLYEQEQDAPQAIAILETLQKNDIVARQATMELADLYRRKEDFAKALPYYNKIIGDTAKLQEKDWVLLYSRGICYERTGEWDKAEADLLSALKLSPRQPEVLNYLAYSWADHSRNLGMALDMLRSALAGAPDDPYITDSVGWTLHRIGRNAEAVPYLETSVQQLPEDPVINDHLGDIYWAVGRRLEARFQWDRALKSVEKKLAAAKLEDAKSSDTELRRQLQDKLQNGIAAPAASMQKTASAGK
ncbi:MAG: repeat-containing protein [Alphaproteobacteria bacterium]|nr:repeat-containing protein [Alphaproteobacteria bacterium]